MIIKHCHDSTCLSFFFTFEIETVLLALVVTNLILDISFMAFSCRDRWLAIEENSKKNLGQLESKEQQVTPAHKSAIPQEKLWNDFKMASLGTRLMV